MENQPKTGDKIGFFHGDGNVVGENIIISGSITINKNALPPNLNPEFQKAILEFSTNLNEKIKGLQIPEEQNKEINESIKELSKEEQDIKPEQELGEIKKSRIRSKLFRIAESVLKVLPKTTETIALFTPLSPFSKQIGEGTRYLIEAIENEL